MKKICLPFLGALVMLTACNRQEAVPEEMETTENVGRKCASHEVLERQIAENPARGRALEELEIKTLNFESNQSRSGVTLYIPVVVNVVLPNPDQVSAAQIQSQIDVLNADFNANNAELNNQNIYLAGYSYSSVANCNIQFVLKGVNRKASAGSFGTNDAVKKTSQGGLDPTSPTTTMNLWVCDLSSGLLGYAQFPGGSAATDGVVCDYQAFGTSASYPMYAQFNKGRTATHEVGHWLNLRHIWGDARCGNDGVADTPSHDASNGGCPSTTHRSRCAGKPLEQWMNYMDYTDDACMYMFTAGQKVRMDAALDASRSTWAKTTAP